MSAIHVAITSLLKEEIIDGDFLLLLVLVAAVALMEDGVIVVVVIANYPSLIGAFNKPTYHI